MKKYVCQVCGYEYDEEVGAPDLGIAPGTKFEDLPEDFECPLCGVGKDILIAVISTYLLAFIQAGASVFNQIESWPITKSLLCHFSVLFFAYSGCYLLNSWIPFEPMVVLIFCLAFIVVYFAVWLTVYLCVKKTSDSLNRTIK